jgi:hypothetical protein
VTDRHDDADPVEHDPTGMRALLGSLPEPGPMPDDLVARITAALDAEGSGAEAPSVAAPGRPADVVPLHRRRGWQLLGAAAAAVVVVGVAGVVIEQAAPGGLQATLGLAGGSADSAAGGSSAEVAAPRAAAGAPVLVLASGPDYTAGGLPAQARALPAPDGGGNGDQKSAAVDTAGAGTVADPAGARSCARALGVGPSSPVVVDVATMSGRPVAVLVAGSTDEPRRAWVVARSCREGAPGVVVGPVAVA